jgi:glutamate synthase domain-containing protein 2
MDKEKIFTNFHLFASDWSILLKVILVFLLFIFIAIFIYDRFIQRKNQLLINYPLIGRLRYLFYMLRGPMRQYFGDETYYNSFEKLDWVNKVASKQNPYLSFSPTTPYGNQKILFKHANFVKEVSEVDEKLSVTFGQKRKIPFVTNSIVGRSAMSDGAISPEGTRAFSMASYQASFPINTGEGGLTSNFLATLNISHFECTKYLEIKKGTWFAKTTYILFRFFTNREVAQRIYRNMVIRQKDKGSFIFDNEKLVYFRINWEKDLSSFPEKVPDGVPDIIFQMGSGLYGVRHKEGTFNPERYQKVMHFAKMTEIKIAQGAKQTGGKLLASKVSEEVAYYRGINANENLISPNRFPYAKDMQSLFDFISELQELSSKPVGFKIVISTKENFEEYAKALKQRKEEGKSIADFITIDGGDGGSATAPLEMMTKIGLPLREALVIVIDLLNAYDLKDDIKIIASEKVLTPDDIVELLCYGADFISIARGFMISAGCIRARECSGANGHHCPVGLATMDEGKRSKYLVRQKAENVANYHNALLEGVRSLMAVMGKTNTSQLSKDDLILSN